MIFKLRSHSTQDIELLCAAIGGRLIASERDGAPLSHYVSAPLSETEIKTQLLTTRVRLLKVLDKMPR